MPMTAYLTEAVTRLLTHREQSAYCWSNYRNKVQKISCNGSTSINSLVVIQLCIVECLRLAARRTGQINKLAGLGNF